MFYTMPVFCIYAPFCNMREHLCGFIILQTLLSKSRENGIFQFRRGLKEWNGRVNGELSGRLVNPVRITWGKQTTDKICLVILDYKTGGISTFYQTSLVNWVLLYCLSIK